MGTAEETVEASEEEIVADFKVEWVRSLFSPLLDCH